MVIVSENFAKYTSNK